MTVDRQKEREGILLDNFPSIKKLKDAHTRRRVIKRLLLQYDNPDDIRWADVDGAIGIENAANRLISPLKGDNILLAIDLGKHMKGLNINFSKIDKEFNQAVKLRFYELLTVGMIKLAIDIKELFGDGMDLSDEVKKAYVHCKCVKMEGRAKAIRKAFPRLGLGSINKASK